MVSNETLIHSEFDKCKGRNFKEYIDLTHYNMEKLPEDITVEEWLSVSHSSLRIVPKNLTVGNTFYLSRCKSLERVSPGLKVGWNLELDGCHSLIEFTGDVYVGRNLDLSFCFNLKRLPEYGKIKVGWDLNLKDCYRLTCLPDRLWKCVGGKILNMPKNLINSMPIEDLILYMNRCDQDSLDLILERLGRGY